MCAVSLLLMAPNDEEKNTKNAITLAQFALHYSGTPFPSSPEKDENSNCEKLRRIGCCYFFHFICKMRWSGKNLFFGACGILCIGKRDARPLTVDRFISDRKERMKER